MFLLRDGSLIMMNILPLTVLVVLCTSLPTTEKSFNLLAYGTHHEDVVMVAVVLVGGVVFVDLDLGDAVSKVAVDLEYV